MNITSNNLMTNPITNEELIKAIDSLKPKKIAIVGNKELYEKLIESPDINKDAIKYSPLVPNEENKIYIMDMEG